MEMCSRCHKRIAVVFITKIENGVTKNEGLCLKCAKELGMKPIDDIITKMGISEDDLSRLEDDMANLGTQLDVSEDERGDEDEDVGAPPIDIPRLVRGFGSAGGSQNQKHEMKSEEERHGRGQSGDSSGDGGRGERKPKRKFLDVYTKNLTSEAAAGRLDRIVGRERELERTIQILCRRQKNNPCLIGEPGVGKTAIAEALAMRVADGNVPYRLQGYEIHLLDLTALVAGTQFRGQFEARMLGLINEVKAAGNVILVIDEVHNIVGSGAAEGSMNAANILKPALSRGEIQVIGATTLTEYRKYIEKDTALERRFQPVTVNEPSIADTIEILRGIKHYYENYHHVKIPEYILERAVVLSERYITDRYLPDKAIDLIDEASSHVSLSSTVINDYLLKLDELDRVTKEYTELEGQQAPSDEKKAQAHYARLAELKSEKLRLSGEVTALAASCDRVEVGISDIAEVIEIWTGIPATDIKEAEFDKLANLEENLKSRIVGQDAAVAAVARAIKRNRAGISSKRKPVSFIFAGPTGVGKTELVKTLASELFNQPETLIRLDMSEFMEKYSVSRIIGSPPGYVGYDDAGQLTEKVRRRPYSVILFDEIEKAHPDVMNILLQILDDGEISDAHGKKVDFCNTVIVMTTNAGSNLSSGTAGFSDGAAAYENDRTMKALSDFLRPEFLNRVDEIITFNSLTRENFISIARIMAGDLISALHERGIEVEFTDAALARIADESYSAKFGARNMRRYIETHVEDVLAEEIVSSRENRVTHALVDAASDGQGLSLSTIKLH
ncbi:MAG: ATP-dependent Clp protease ATP-binding subunit [Firmicutes bacterium]|nr:ATP-dependent Clp protease ATP-binding subunit [Bacillota bacterium]